MRTLAALAAALALSACSLVYKIDIQQGNYVAQRILAELAGRPHPPFRYRDKGNLATIGRARAVADFGHGKLKVSGLLAWLLWVGVHLWYLIGFQNRAVVFLRWIFSFITRGRGSRIISAQSLSPRAHSD